MVPWSLKNWKMDEGLIPRVAKYALLNVMLTTCCGAPKVSIRLTPFTAKRRCLISLTLRSNSKASKPSFVMAKNIPDTSPKSSFIMGANAPCGKLP